MNIDDILTVIGALSTQDKLKVEKYTHISLESYRAEKKAKKAEEQAKKEAAYELIEKEHQKHIIEIGDEICERLHVKSFPFTACKKDDEYPHSTCEFSEIDAFEKLLLFLNKHYNIDLDIYQDKELRDIFEDFAGHVNYVSNLILFSENADRVYPGTVLFNLYTHSKYSRSEEFEDHIIREYEGDDWYTDFKFCLTEEDY